MREGSWLLHHLDELGRIGSTPEGGRTRLAFSAADDEGRRYVARLMTETGLAVREDAVGNVFGRLEGRDAALPAVLVGSHVDTVPNAGKYDGCLGVLAAIAAVRALPDRPRHGVEVVSFAGEESSRFGLSLIGSRAFAGTLDPAVLERYVDADGISLGRALRERGGTDPRAAACPPGRYRAFLELHIEQGAYLADAGRQVGVITGIAAPLRIRFVIQGEAAHSGASRLERRKDALMAVSRVLVQVEDLVRREGDSGTIATVGHLVVSPNVMNVVPGQVEFTLDVRGVQEDSRRRLARAIQRAVGREAALRGMGVAVEVLGEDPPVPLSAGLQRLLGRVCDDLGVAWMPMPSMAGHDAMQVSRVCPTGMLFCRNVSRTSHSPVEEVADEDAIAGAQVLAEAVRRLAAGEPI